MLIDIELQFVERVVPAPEFGEYIGKTVRILQSRKLVRVATYGDGIGYGGGVYDEWTEWADVPLAPQAGVAKGEAA